ncbi:ABC transporter permease [Flavobacterium suzhouense]|uniref:ABC transporter permease n=1 Tax=Flavobacterium suzhouense TaxID=1529638 RepID=A0ABW5NT57_9FLAO
MQKAIDIHSYLPHRDPMLMVDFIVNITAEKAETVFTIKEDNVFLDNGVFCEAGLIENAAQTCSSIVGKSYLVDDQAKDIPNVDVIGFISSIRTVKIHKLPRLGSAITTVADLISRYDTGGYTTCMVNCKSYCNDELLLEGEINLFIQER